MRQRLGLLVAALVAVGLVVAALVAGSSSQDPATSAARTDPGTSSDPGDPDAVDVLVLVPDSTHADDDQELVAEAIDMWRQGTAGLGDPALEWLQGADFRVTAETLGDQASYAVTDPEVVIVAATPPGSSPSPSSGGLGELELYDATDALCDTVDDPFDFASWSTRPGFSSHHSLPEGTLRQDCGGEGGSVCFAVNATLGGPATSMESVFETYGLVSDEVGHCLARRAGGSGGQGG